MNSNRVMIEKILEGLQSKGEGLPCSFARKIRDNVKKEIKGKELTNEEWGKIHSRLNRALEVNKINRIIKRISELDCCISFETKGLNVEAVFHFNVGEHFFLKKIFEEEILKDEIHDFNFVSFDFEMFKDELSRDEKELKEELSKVEKLFNEINLKICFKILNNSLRWVVFVKGEIVFDETESFGHEIEGDYWIDYPKMEYKKIS